MTTSPPPPPSPGPPAPGPWVERWLSQPRHGVYLAASQGDPQLALDLYEWNAEISATASDGLRDFFRRTTPDGALVHDFSDPDLGTRFLGHVERTRVPLHLVSAQEEKVGQAYKTVKAELNAYGGGLTDKREIVALSQIDVLDEKELKKKAKELEKACGRPPLLLSAAAHIGMTEALRALRRDR